MLLGLLVVDRGAALVAGRLLAGEVQRAGDLVERPDVDIGGFPFLTQAVRGRYSDVEVVARDVSVGEFQGSPVQLATLEATLSGVWLPLSDVLSRTVTSVPVERLAGRALLPYDALSRGSGDRRTTVSAEGEQLRVSGSVRVLGQDLTGSAVSSVELDDEELVVTAESFDFGGELTSQVLTRALRDRIDVRLPLDGLPYGLAVQDVDVQESGVAVTAQATDTVLSPPPA